MKALLILAVLTVSACAPVAAGVGAVAALSLENVYKHEGK